MDAILQAALHVLVEEGSGAFTLRRIATECNLQVGNVSRHFPRKEMLVQVLLNEILTASDDHLEKGDSWSDLSPEDKLVLIITGTLENNETKTITNLFTELWAMSNHNDFVAERMKLVYQYVHDLLEFCIRGVNPELSDSQIETLAIFINATMEGAIVLGGHGKPWSTKMPEIKTMSAKLLVDMVKSVRPEKVEVLQS